MVPEKSEETEQEAALAFLLLLGWKIVKWTFSVEIITRKISRLCNKSVNQKSGKLVSYLNSQFHA